MYTVDIAHQHIGVKYSYISRLHCTSYSTPNCCFLLWFGTDRFTNILQAYFFGNGPLPRYVKLLVAHVPGMPETFSPPTRFSDPDMHHGACVTLVPWCMPRSLTSDFLWSRWWGKCSRHSRRMRNPQFYVSGKRPMVCLGLTQCQWTNREGYGCKMKLCH